jgi:hypothetical protein
MVTAKRIWAHRNQVLHRGAFHESMVAEALGTLNAAEFGRDLGVQDISLEGGLSYGCKSC